MSKAPAATPRRRYSFGPLYDFLAEVFPNHRSAKGLFDVPNFGKDLGYSHEAIYRSLRERDLLSQNVALKIMKLSRTDAAIRPIFWDDLIPYVVHSYKEFRKPASAPAAEIDDLLG